MFSLACNFCLCFLVCCFVINKKQWIHFFGFHVVAGVARVDRTHRHTRSCHPASDPKSQIVRNKSNEMEDLWDQRKNVLNINGGGKTYKLEDVEDVRGGDEQVKDKLALILEDGTWIWKILESKSGGSSCFWKDCASRYRAVRRRRNGEWH